MQQRLSVVTLGVADMDRARRFYEGGLGWRRANSHAEVAFYQLGGMVLSLFSRAGLAEDAGLAEASSPSRTDSNGHFGGVSLGLNLAGRDEVDAVMAEARLAGARILKPAQEAFWGGYHGYFADPDGHVWEIAWNPEWALAEDGRLALPYGD